MGGFEFGGEVLRGRGVVGVVDGDVAALGGEGAGDFGAETSGMRVNGVYSLVEYCFRLLNSGILTGTIGVGFDLAVAIGICVLRPSERAYLDPPVMRTLRPLREYGILALGVLG